MKKAQPAGSRAFAVAAALVWVGCGSVGAGTDGGRGMGGGGGSDAGGTQDTATGSGGGGAGGGTGGGTGGAAADARLDGQTPADGQVRCDQPVSNVDCTGQVPRSCAELYTWGARAEAAYKIDPDGAGANPAFVTLCEMNTRDQTGWTLMAKVHIANTDSVDEPRTWFLTEANAGMLVSRTLINNQPPAAHGAYKFAPLIKAGSIARFELYAQLDTTQKATWYKVVASATSLQGWFTANDTTASRVCTDLDLTLNCSDGTISPDGSATLMNGMTLLPFGYAGGTGPIHMRLNDDQSPNNSGVCSSTLDAENNKWKDSYSTHWGNALLIWLN